MKVAVVIDINQIFIQASKAVTEKLYSSMKNIDHEANY